MSPTARAGSAHLMYSEARPEGRGQDTPKTTPCCSSRSPFSMTTGSPLEDHKHRHQQHSLDSVKMHTVMSVPHHHTPNTIARPTSCVGGTTPPLHNHYAGRLSSSRILLAIAPGSSSSLSEGIGFGWTWVKAWKVQRQRHAHTPDQ